jgi:HK97 gp10 family phage protein
MATPTSNVEIAVTKGALKIEAGAKRRAPVDTGYLRESINHRLEFSEDETVAIIGTNVDYAPHQEFGTEKMPPQSFLRPSLEEEIEGIKEDIKAALIKDVKDGFGWE